MAWMAVVLGLLLAGCGSSKKTAAPNGLVKSSDRSFATVLPPGFNDLNSVESTAYRTLYSVASRAGLAVVVFRSPAPAGVSIDAWTRRLMGVQKKDNPSDRGFSSVSKVTVGGVSGRGFSYSGRSSSGQPTAYAQVIVVHAGSSYLIQGRAPAGQQRALVSAMNKIDLGWHWT
ncbi:MAG: hypothetical protein J2O48_10530 [Solirubrobacterales bacterium]|nr:hypothetical protein [Solirubrobacterales bacterium]